MSRAAKKRYRSPEYRRRYRLREYEQNRTVARELGVPVRGDSNYTHRHWTYKELRILQENAYLTAVEIARILGTRTPKAVSNMRLYLRSGRER